MTGVQTCALPISFLRLICVLFFFKSSCWNFCASFSLQVIPEEQAIASGFSTKAKGEEPSKKASSPKGKDKNVPSSSHQGGKTAETPLSQMRAEGSDSSHDPLATPSGQVRIFSNLEFFVLLSGARQCSRWE